MSADVWSAAPDAALAYRDSLPSGALEVFPISGLDRTGIPTWKAVLFADDPALGTQQGHGYGATDAQALLGALGELAEGAHGHAALAALPRRRASHRALVAAGGTAAAIDPRRLCLPAGSPVDDATELLWVRGERHPSGEPVWLPLDVVAIEPGDAPGYEPFTTAITNGLGAGPTLPFALAHGLGELVQRDGNGLRFRALDAGVALDLAGIADPVVRATLARLERAGIEPLVKLASDEFGIANVYVVGAERPGVAAPLPIAVTAAGEAASPSRDAAVRKALLEFGAARPRKIFAHAPLELLGGVAPASYLARVRARPPALGESRALDAMLAWLALDQAALRATIAEPILRVRETRDAATLPAWEPAPGGVPGAALLATLTDRLGAAGLEICFVDLTTAVGAARGVRVVKAIVPGLEVETMSYRRIGERNARALLRAGSPLVARAPGAGRARVRLLADAEDRLGGPVWLDVAEVDRTVGALYPLYREPGVHVAAFARATAAR